MKTVVKYEDKDVLVAYKPSGIATQSARITDVDMVSELKAYLKAKNKSDYLGVVHRLDQPVSGLLVFGLNKKSTAFLSAQLVKGTLNKKYHATICGRIEPESGCMVDRMFKSSDNRAIVLHDGEEPNSMTDKVVRAELKYRTIEVKDDISVLEVELITGRFHQIRAQFAYKGFPLIGDVKYGSTYKNVKEFGLKAVEIEFMHPNGKMMKFSVD